MPPPPGGLFQAFVLHRRDYSNTSLLLDIFARGQGRFSAIAKGARRKGNPASALLQPFQPLWLAALGRGEVRTLIRTEEADRPFALAGRRLLGGFYLNELLVRLLGRYDPHDRLFDDYWAALARLANADDFDTLLRRFELRLLDALGYGLTLDRTFDGGGSVQAERSYILELDLGVRQALDGEPGVRLSGATLLALTHGVCLESGQRREARRLLRRILEPHLGGRPLRSRELYQRWYGGRSEHDPANASPNQRTRKPCL